MVKNDDQAARVEPVVMPSLDECEVRHLQTRYKKAIRYAIGLQRAIEYHCRGEIVPERVAEGCPYHAAKLNERLKVVTSEA